MKIWDKKSGNHFPEILEKFTVGNDRDFDILLAEYDIIGSIAHAEMLAHVGLITDDEFKSLKKELDAILEEVHSGWFKISGDAEDVHSYIEYLLTSRLGEVGKKIHTGRSRNDQVLLDIKLYLKAEIKSITELVKKLFDRFIALSEANKTRFLPGYTHFQAAMPSSFGLWFGAYAESLAEDMEMLVAAHTLCNKNPLGSGAGFGSSFPLDREMTTRLLGFGNMHYNVVNAQMSRGKTEKWVAVAISAIAATLSRFSYDICLYMGADFGFISFPDHLTTGSSIMPHKKNPDVFELIRARCNRIQAVPNELTLLINNLPSGYHRDMQLTKECLFPSISSIRSCLEAAIYMLGHIIINDDLLKKEKYDLIFSVEKVNEYVLQGIPFREAYKKVGEELANGTYKPADGLNHTHKGSIGQLCNKEIARLMNDTLAKMV